MLCVTWTRMSQPLARHLRFQKSLWTLFAAEGVQPGISSADALVCRCEAIDRDALMTLIAQSRPTALGNVKRLTRADIGRCQGRYCGAVIATLLANSVARRFEESDLWAPRPPIKPVTLAELSTLEFPDDTTRTTPP
ncbi:MAG: hypothetical protein CMO26_09805 [Thiotrichales bacterium]|nr:hypothetical protein [Thiotrichales bacterium]